MTNRVVENVFLKDESEMEEEGVCKKCGGSGEVLIEYGSGDDFHQDYVRCECKLAESDSDMSGAE